MTDAADLIAKCLSCRNPLWDSEIQAGRYACFRCEDKAAEQLHAIRGTFKRLNTADGHEKVRGGGGGPTGSKEPPVPVRLAVLNATAPGGVVAQLQSGIEDSWRKALGWQMGRTRHHADIDGATTFLINNLPWACERYDEIADDLQAIASIHGRLKGLETGEPAAKKFAAYCNADCDGQLSITLWTSRATCPSCGTEYDKAELAGLVTQYDEVAA